MDYENIYLNNNYEIEDVLTFNLEEIQKYKKHPLLKKTFAIITAFNPNNELLRCIQNQDRHLKLRDSINSLKLEYTFAIGYLDDHSEEGYLIYNISFNEAIELAKEYEQYAIYYNDPVKKNTGYYKCKDKSVIIEKNI